MYLHGRITHGLCGLLVLRHIFKLLGINEPFEEKKFVTLGPFLLFYFLQKRLSRCVGSVFVTRSKKHTVADVGHSDNKAVKRNVKMPKGPAKC